MKHIHFLAFLLILTVIILFPVGCASSPPPAAGTVLSAMQDAAGQLPAGQVYDLRNDPSARGYLSDTLFSALYGPAARGLLGSGGADAGDGRQPMTATAAITDAAVFLPEVPHPGELAVMICPDADSALSAAALCRLRLDLLKNAWKDSEYAVWTERAAVTVEDCCVLMAVTTDPDTVFEAARQVIRHPQQAETQPAP
ncbi:MAG: hypothetical protein MJ192_08135 [Clostridia bacterium]|nr:hypothetical protein [Clostridia bacterium]